MAYKSGKIISGTQTGLNVTTAESTDVEKAKPKVKGSLFKSHYIPFNTPAPDGRMIAFTGGYFATEDEALIKFIKEQLVGKHCELC